MTVDEDGGMPTARSIVGYVHRRTLHAAGVVVVPNWRDLEVREVALEKGRGIKSFVAHGYDDTRGNVTQEKCDVWQPGTPGQEYETAGWFKRHGHPDMDEAFRVVRGEVTFHYWTPTPEGHWQEHSIVLGAGGYIYFPAGVEHEGWNSGATEAELCICLLYTSPSPRDS